MPHYLDHGQIGHTLLCVRSLLWCCPAPSVAGLRVRVRAARGEGHSGHASDCAGGCERTRVMREVRCGTEGVGYVPID